MNKLVIAAVLLSVGGFALGSAVTSTGMFSSSTAPNAPTAYTADDSLAELSNAVSPGVKACNDKQKTARTTYMAAKKTFQDAEKAFRASRDSLYACYKSAGWTPRPWPSSQPTTSQ